MYKKRDKFTAKFMAYKNVSSLLLLYLLLTSSLTHATEIPNHYIIAFDRSIESRRTFYESNEILKIINNTLLDNDFQTESDYISIVGYTMEYGNPNIERYARLYNSKDGPIAWYQPKGKTLLELFPDWPTGEPTLEYYNSPFGSMQSLAKPFAVIETKRDDSSCELANRTFLYVITDEVVNGTDDNYRQEWRNASSCYGSNWSQFEKFSNHVFNTLQLFNEEFKFIQIKLNKGNAKFDKLPISPDGVYKIVPYEVVSVERPSIHAITNIPSPLPIQRVKGGFSLKFDSHSYSQKYKIINIEISDTKGALLGSTDSGKLDVFLPSEKISVGDSIRLSLTVSLNDGHYNGVIISPTNPRYRDGMTVNQLIKIQNETKILGVLPLSDSFWWWFPNDIFSAILIWDLIIILAFIIVIGYIFYRCFVRINTYKPSNDKITINKTE